MPRPKGIPKTGGRQKGSGNKIDKELKERLALKYPDWCPVEAMCKIAQEEADPKIRVIAAKEVAQYIYPKLKSIDHVHKGDKDNPINHSLTVEFL